MKVSNFVQLQEAIDNNENIIEMSKSISAPNMINLKKGQKLIAKEKNIFLSFINGDGIGLSGQNEISDISIQTSPRNRAIFIDSSEEDLGDINLNNLTVTGVVQILTRGNNKKLNLNINKLDIVSADARFFCERPMKYGVNVYQGALTVYNFNPQKDSIINVKAEDISIGRKNAPVIGSGVFISGFNDESGFVIIEKLTTADIYSNGMIPLGQPNLITGGIFIVYGAYAKEIESYGCIYTYGTNDMVLDVWGRVDNWLVKEDVISYGSSGIGFVNFGTVKNFLSEKNIITYGNGSRGFNQYDGTIEEAYFENIITMGDGSIGMQFSKPVGKITIGNKVSTSGSEGETLVKGEIKTLKADAISVLKGGAIKEFIVNGDLITKGNNVITYHINGGTVEKFDLKGNLIAEGEGSKKESIE